LIASDPDIVTDVAPEERWNYDLFAVAGKAKEIVADDRVMAAEIRNYKYLLFPFIFHALIYETSG
jgi:hypothetical protein